MDRVLGLHVDYILYLLYYIHLDWKVVCNVYRTSNEVNMLMIMINDVWAHGTVQRTQNRAAYVGNRYLTMAVTIAVMAATIAAPTPAAPIELARHLHLQL